MFRAEPIKSEINKKLLCSGVDGFINITPLKVASVLSSQKNWENRPICMPQLYYQNAEDIAQFQCRKDDIWIVTYPKCGTTWTQEMVWLIMNDLDFNKAKTIDITQRSIFLELNCVVRSLEFNSIDALNQSIDPRIIKTHLPMGLLPLDIWKKKSKIIYVSRDPKDVVVSFFHHFKHMVGFEGSISDFSETFLTHQLSYCSFWNHILEFWNIRHMDNVLFLTYEDMKDNLNDVVLKVCKFLGKKYSDNEISELLTHLSFDQMKNNATCNNQGLVKMSYSSIGKEYKEENAFRFMRKGKVGSYKLELPKVLIERLNQQTKEILHKNGCNLY